MFVTRNRSVGRLAEGEARAGSGEEGEPSSPKVTCIGQVRIRNKNKKKRDTTTTFKSKDRRPTPTETAVERCRCLQRPLLCGMCAGWRKGPGGRPWRSLWWRQWEFSLRSGKGRRYQQRRSIEKEADLMKPPIEMVGGGEGGGVFESDREEYRDDDDDEEKLENEEEEDETRFFVSSATTAPPKNALLLMRCRSAPHNRASSLAANRFTVSVSPLPPSESKSSPAEKKVEVGDDEEEKKGRNSSNGSSIDGGEGGQEGSRPLVLTRCKSEPARKAVVPRTMLKHRLHAEDLVALAVRASSALMKAAPAGERIRRGTVMSPLVFDVGSGEGAAMGGEVRAAKEERRKPNKKGCGIGRKFTK